MKHILILVFALGLGLSTQAQRIREFILDDINSQKQAYKDLKGEKLTVIDFWASWCKPCLKAIPNIEKLYQANKDKGVAVLGISCDGPRSIAKVAPLSRTLKVSYPMLTDVSNSVMKDLEITALPTLLIVDKNNKIVYRHEGFTKGDEYEMQAKIDELLGQ